MPNVWVNTCQTDAAPGDIQPRIWSEIVLRHGIRCFGRANVEDYSFCAVGTVQSTISPERFITLTKECCTLSRAGCILRSLDRCKAQVAEAYPLCFLLQRLAVFEGNSSSSYLVSWAYCYDEIRPALVVNSSLGTQGPTKYLSPLMSGVHARIACLSHPASKHAHERHFPRRFACWLPMQ